MFSNLNKRKYWLSLLEVLYFSFSFVLTNSSQRLLKVIRYFTYASCNSIDEETQKMSQSRSTDFRGTTRNGDEQIIMTKQIPHMKSPAYKRRRTATEELHSTLVISNSKGLSETLRDIRTLTYQSCGSEENNKSNNHI